MRNNFSFKKHQRELAKKKKKEDKAQAKLARKNALASTDSSAPVSDGEQAAE